MFLRPPSPQLPLHYLSAGRKWPLWAGRQNLQETFVGAGSSGISGGEISSSSCLMWADVSSREQAQTLGLPDTGPPWAAYGPCPLMHSTGTVASSCRPQVTCRGTAQWAMWPLNGELTEGSASPGFPENPREKRLPPRLSRGQNTYWFAEPGPTGTETVPLRSTAA